MTSFPTSDVDLLSPGAIAAPHRTFRALRDEAPAIWMNRHRAWLLTTHQAVRLGFHDLRLSSDRLTPLEARLDDETRALLGETFGLLRGWMVFHDPPEHERLREPLRRAFTPNRIAALRPRIETLVDELIDGVVAADDREPDLVAEFAFPLPAIVIAELLGVPAEDRDEFKHWSDQLAAIVFGTSNRAAGAVRAAAGSARFATYFAGLIERYSVAPADNLISALIAVTGDDPDVGLAPSELVGALTLLLFGGHETTTNLISNSVHSLLAWPDALAWVRERPDRLGDALEELHRYDGSTKLMVRIVAEDHERDGVEMRAGQTVLLGVASANRDEDVYEDADTLRLDRPNSRTHLGFGVGRHFCLGAALARLETELAIGRLVERIPGLAPGTGDVAWSEVLLGRGLSRLPVRVH